MNIIGVGNFHCFPYVIDRLEKKDTTLNHRIVFFPPRQVPRLLWQK